MGQFPSGNSWWPRQRNDHFIKHNPKSLCEGSIFNPIRLFALSDAWMLTNTTCCRMEAMIFKWLRNVLTRKLISYREEVSPDASCRPLLTWKRVSSEMPYCSNGSYRRHKERKKLKMQQFTHFIIIVLIDDIVKTLTLPVSLWISVL